MQDVVIFGASGYSGLELLRILAWHSGVRVVAASSDRWQSRAVADAVAGWPSSLRFEAHDDVFAGTREGQLALLATPAKTSAELAPRLLDRGLRVVDLSGAFRLVDPQQFFEWYGFEHPRPDLAERAQYGLPELLPVAADATLVANPGCYATAAIMVLAPLLKADLVRPEGPIIIDGKSGTTGAGRTAKEDLLFSEVGENLRAYRVARHQHTPEIERALHRVVGRAVTVSFTAHLIPMRRGILASAYLPAKPTVTAEDVKAAYDAAYGGHSFVRLVDRPPQTAATRDTNFVELGATLDTRTTVLCAFAAIDNLVKGAAGQAVQNMNRLLGLSDGHGLIPTEAAK